MFWKFLLDERGVTAIEYTFIAAAIGMAVIVTMPLLSSSVGSQFTNLASQMSAIK